MQVSSFHSRPTLAALLLILIAGLAICSQHPSLRAESRGNSGSERAAGFELKDQYNQVNSYRFPKSKPTILVFGDRRGSEQIEGWVRPVWDRYQDRIDQKGVAVLSAVPVFMRGIIRSMFKSKVKYPVLLDWTGEVARAYAYHSGKANLVLIDQQGVILLRLTGPVSREGLQELYARIDRLITMS
ncbi:MAG: hypothetical protein EBZ36_08800 [Acidobacteria bacterium]|nr:hypothetical protein [Acidobacteriota bacterium]